MSTRSALHLLTILSIACALSTSAQLYPLHIELTILPPYSPDLTSYFGTESNVSFTVFNNSMETKSFYLVGSITSDDGSISVSLPGGTAWNAAPLNADPGGPHSFDGAALRPIGQGLESEAVFFGTSPAQLGSQPIPEGSYRLCIRAYDYANPTTPLSDEFDGCATIIIREAEPPEPLNPTCNGDGTGEMVTPQTPQLINFQWILPGGQPTFGVTITYHFRLVRIDNPSNAQAALETSTDVIFEDDVMNNILSYNQAFPALEPGRMYAWWVQAIADPPNLVSFRNNGFMRPCTFNYTAFEDTEFSLSFPTQQDTLPWDLMPLMARFQPHAPAADEQNTTGRFWSRLHLSRNGEQLPPVIYRQGENNDIDWAHGYFNTQRELLGYPPDFTEEHARNINIYTNDPAPSGRFQRGSTYTISADLRTNTYAGNDVRYGDAEGVFVSGMGKPRPISPLNGTVLPRDGGDEELDGFASVPLHFKTAEAPINTVPPFPIWIIPGTGPASQTQGTAHERWRLEVSRSADMADPVYSTTNVYGPVQLNNPVCDGACIEAFLYRDVSVNFTPNDTGKYYWRVAWLLDPSIATGPTYHAGPVRMFRILGEGSPPPEAEEERPRECVSVCKAGATPLAQQIGVSTAAMGDTVSVGLFKLRIGTITWAGGRANGAGLIDVPFMHCPLNVDFSNAEINEQKKLFKGDVFAKLDNESLVPAAWRMGAGLASGFSPGAVKDIDDFLNASGRLVNQLDGNTPMGLPIGIATDIPGGRFTVGIVGMRFTDTTATLNAMMSVPVPELGFNYGLGVSDQVFQPDGVGCPDKDALLYLVDAVRIGIGSDSLILKSTRFEPGNMINVLDSGTFAAWDCRGFRALQIDAEWRFSRDHLKEDKPDGTSGPDKIIASLKTRTGRGGFMGRVDFNKPFHIEGAEGWGFDVQEAWMDLASYTNPPAMNLPPNVAQRVGSVDDNGNPINTWRGFYLKRAMLRLPNEVKRFGSTERVTGVVDDLVIVGAKVTASFKLTNLIGESEGELDGWAFSLDTLQFDIVANSFSQAGIKGRIRTAISPTLLDYSAMLRQDPTNERKWLEFLLQPERDLVVPFLVATVTLDETSTVRAALRDPVLGNYAKATLNGLISIDQQTGGIPINFRDVKFQGLRFQTRAPYTNIDSSAVFSLASPQKYLGASDVLDDDDPLTPTPGGSTGGFPISLTRVDGVRTTIDGKPAAGVAFDINLNLTGTTNIFQATTRIEVLGTLNTSEIHQWGDNEVRLDSIGVTGGTGAVEVSGGLKWYRDSPTYGNGIKGGLRAKFMKGKIDILATAQFGSVGTNKYWYVDAMAAKEGGWNKPSAFTIYGFGGGAWYHMAMPITTPPAESITQQELTHLNDEDFEPGLSLSGMTYTPNAGVDLGFKATIVFGDPSSGYAYNGNITALAQFAGGGLQSIGLTTDVYMLHKKEVDGVIEGHVPIKGHGEITYTFATDVFAANFDMFVDVRPNLLVGTGTNKLAGRLEVLITPDTWHFYVGRPDSRVGLKIAGFVQSGSYFMVGDDLPGVPLPPPEVASLVPADYLVREDISDASGLAFGTEVSFADTGDFLVFRYKVNGVVGFDLLFTGSSTMECAGIDDPGIGPFYARGQLYGAVNAALSIFVDLAIASGEYDIFTVGVAGMFQCGFANPSWLKGFAHGEYSILWGAVSGSATVPFQAGTHCEPPQSNMLDGLDPIGDLSPLDRSGLPPGCTDFLKCGVDCGVEPQAVFNLKVANQFEFNEVTASHQFIRHVVRISIDKFELKNEAGEVVPCNRNLAANGMQVSLHPHAYLTPKKQFTVTIKLKAEELKNGVWAQALNSAGQPAVWQRTHTFKTDGGIEELNADNIDYSYPYFRQRFVLQDECRNGVIECNGNLADQPIFKSPYGKRRSFKIVIMSLTGGTPVEQVVIPDHYDNTRVAFTLPPLMNNRTFSVKLVAKDVFDASNLAFSADGPAQQPSGPGQTPVQQAAMVNTQTMSMGEVASSTTTSNLGMVRRISQTIQGYALRPDEKLLYEYHFRTSQYNTLPEKVTALLNTSTDYSYTAQLPPKETLTPSFTGERFDVYDLVGFEYGEQDAELQMHPLIGVQDAKSDFWHKQFAKPIMYDYYAAIKASNCSELELARTVTTISFGFYSETHISDEPDHIGIPPVHTVRFHPDGPAPSQKLSDAETVSSSTMTQFNPGTLSVSAGGPATGPPLTARLQYKTANWVRDDYVRLQTITPDVISNCGPLNHSTGGDDVYYEMAEPLRSYVIAFQNTPYKRMFRGSYGAEFLFFPPPPCASYAVETNDVITYSKGVAIFQHPTGSTPPTPNAGAAGISGGTTIQIH